MQNQRHLMSHQPTDQPPGDHLQQMMVMQYNVNEQHQQQHTLMSNSRYQQHSHNHRTNQQQDHYLHLQPPSQNLIHKQTIHNHNNHHHHNHTLDLHHSHNQHHQSQSQHQRNSARLKQIASYAAQQVANEQLQMDALHRGIAASEAPPIHSGDYVRGHVTQQQSYGNQQALGAGYFPQQQPQQYNEQMRGSSPLLVRPRVGSVSSQTRPSPAQSSSPNFAITRSTSFSTPKSYNDSQVSPRSPATQSNKSQSPLNYLQMSPLQQAAPASSPNSAAANQTTMSPSDALSLGINLEQYISKRNERERSRVRNVNDAFDNLKNSLPLKAERQSKRLSKVEILRTAIGYIRNMENILGFKQQHSLDTGSEHQSRDSSGSMASPTSMSDLSAMLLSQANAASSGVSSNNSTAPTSTSTSPTSSGGNISSAPYYQLAQRQQLQTGSQQQRDAQPQQHVQMTPSGENWNSQQNNQSVNQFNYQDLMKNLEYERNQQQFQGQY